MAKHILNSIKWETTHLLIWEKKFLKQRHKTYSDQITSAQNYRKDFTKQVGIR